MKYLIWILLFSLATNAFAKEDQVILDVRTAEEYAQGHAKNAVNIDFYRPDFDKQIAQLSKDKQYFVYCKAGGRSGKTASKMRSLGFKNIEDIKTSEAAIAKFGLEK